MIVFAVKVMSFDSREPVKVKGTIIAATKNAAEMLLRLSTINSSKTGSTLIF